MREKTVCAAHRLASSANLRKCVTDSLLIRASASITSRCFPSQYPAQMWGFGSVLLLRLISLVPPDRTLFPGPLPSRSRNSWSATNPVERGRSRIFAHCVISITSFFASCISCYTHTRTRRQRGSILSAPALAPSMHVGVSLLLMIFFPLTLSISVVPCTSCSYRGFFFQAAQKFIKHLIGRSDLPTWKNGKEDRAEVMR